MAGETNRMSLLFFFAGKPLAVREFCFAGDEIEKQFRAE
jgi:hypothetical protein